MAIDRETVEHVALLARLDLTEDEIERMTKDLGSILDYIDQLTAIDTDGVEPMEHVSTSANVFREDQVAPPLARDQALRASPSQDGQFFRVPPIIE